MRTKAAIVYELNQPVVVEELELDEPKFREVLIKMTASGVCHSDLSVINGTIPNPLPMVIGHEGAGLIEQVGKDVSYVVPGDHVVLSYRPTCGSCLYCTMGRPCLCVGFPKTRGKLLDGSCRLHKKSGQDIHQMANIGTMSEYIIAAEQSLVKIEPHYPLERAVLVGCGVTTGIGAVIHTAAVEAGSSLAVFGTGGVGLNVIQGGVLAGAAKIIAVDVVDKKLEYAKQFGATHVVNASKVDAVLAIKDLTHGYGVDYAFEVIGNPKTIKQAYQAVRNAGSAIVVGIPHYDAPLELSAHEIPFSEKRLIGSLYGSSRPRQDMPRLLQLYSEGKVKLDELVTRTYRLEEVNQAFSDLENGLNARGVIVF